MSRVRSSFDYGRHDGPNYLRVEEYPGWLYGQPYGKRRTTLYGDWTTDSQLGVNKCIDTVSLTAPFVVDHDLDIEKVWVVPFQRYGFYTTWGSYGKRKEYHFGGNGDTNSSSYSGAQLLFQQDNISAKGRMDGYAIDAIGNANPSNPDVDVLLFLYEFKDFPRMLRDMGRILNNGGRLTDWPGQNLAFQFGWKPLLGDLKKLLQFQQVVEKRLNYLNRLGSGKIRLRRTLKNQNTVQQGQNLSIMTHTFKTEYSYSEHVWYVAQVSADSLPTSSEERAALARRLAYSTTLSVGTIWNAIPWSWLIDWFTNIGSYIEANTNKVGFQWEDLNVCMTYKCSRTTTLLSSTVPSSVTATEPECHSLLKLRRVHHHLPIDLVELPVVNGRMLSILGSLVLASHTKDAW